LSGNVHSETSPEQIDEATSQRLGKLRSMPLDTARLDAMLEVQIPRPASGRMEGLFRQPAVRIVAGLIGIVVVVGLIYRNHSGGAVLVSPESMARLHEDLVNGKMDAKPIHSIEDANSILADGLGGLQIPQVPNTQAMLCSLQMLKDKRLACVLLYGDGVPVTMAVARAMEIRVPDSFERKIEKGTEYPITTSGKLQIIIKERRGRWICLISELPVERLLEIAQEIQL
jgi:hypothetical protein